MVVFDLETRRLAAEVGGWDALRSGKGGISAVVVWDSTTHRPHIYDSHRLADAAKHLEAADVVLSFNGIEFDVPVLEGVLGRRLVLPIHLDLLQLIWKSLTGRRKGNTLDEIAKRTLNEGKIEKGTHAPALADEGRWGELFDYCLHDVELTRRLFRVVQRDGGVVGLDGNLMELPLPHWFGDCYLGSAKD